MQDCNHNIFNAQLHLFIALFYLSIIVCLHIIICIILLLYIDLRPGQTCHSKVMHRKEVTHSDDSYEKKSRRQAWLKKWDKVKSHGTLIDWCTGREWPVNCMTVISAWWRSNMPFQRLSGRLNYYITRWDRKSVSWRSDELVTRCGRESQQKAEPLGLWLSSPGERERHNADGHKSGGQYVAVLFGLQLPLTHTHTQPFQIKWEVYFFKEVFARFYSLRQYVFCMYICIVVACGSTTLSLQMICTQLYGIEYSYPIQKKLHTMIRFKVTIPM